MVNFMKEENKKIYNPEITDELKSKIYQILKNNGNGMSKKDPSVKTSLNILKNQRARLEKKQKEFNKNNAV